ncbi:MAG: polysaccharide biosynthesis tyrosine autokinase [Candidatus Marinimicrobia bacterium]|nr:polysaccharide biosynthesis tyrosine autokinase [Candidatus Neomarinimicrobiota bacterium]
MEDHSPHNSPLVEYPQITLKDILRKILRAKWWIISSATIIFLITGYVTISTPPVYQATASVMIETSNRAQKLFNFGMNNDFKISDEIALIKSRTVAEDVVKSLWNTNKRNRLYVFGTKVFMPRGQRLRRPIRKLLSMGKWTPEQNQPPQYEEEYSPEIGQKFHQNIINTLSVNYKRGANIIHITCSSPHPYEAALIANQVAQAYKTRDREWSNNESIHLKSFLESRLNEKESEIEATDLKIQNYKKENQIYDLEGNVENLLNNLTGVESEFNSNNLEINILSSQKEYLNEQLSGLEKGIVDQMLSSINAQLSALKTQVNEKEAELVRNATVYGSEHEAVLKTKENLQILKNQLEEKTNELIAEGLSIVDPLDYRQELIGKLLEIETELHRLEAKSSQSQRLLKKYQNEIRLLPEKQSYLGKLEREKKVLSNTYSYIRQKMEEARVSMASEPGKVRMIDKAEIPRKPVAPHLLQNLIMALFIGALLGFGISISIEYFDNTLRSVEYVERLHLPILAIIPSIGKGVVYSAEKKGKSGLLKNGGRTVGNLQRRMVTHEDPKSPISEAYRSLRTSLMYTRQGDKGSIMVSSPGPGEGKTTTIINLAITYANLGKKTILIDGDLRKPVLHKVFKSNQENGLTHFLSGIEKDWKKVVHSCDIPNLEIIYNGAIPPNPSELLGSDLMVDFVSDLKKNYDVILFDAPPIMAVTDAVVLSRLIDQFIIVVRFGSTAKDSIDHTLKALKHVGSKPTGVVFNDLNQKNSYYSKSYYSYQHYYYTTESQN